MSATLPGLTIQRLFLLILLGGAIDLYSPVAAAQGTSLAGEDVEIYQPPHLIVDAAAEPVPALKYRLLTPLEEELPGNAAVIYDRIVHDRGDKWLENLGTETDPYLRLPREEFSLDEARELLGTYRDVSVELAAAARRSDCDWTYALEGADPILLRIADAVGARQFAPLLGMKMRYEVFSGDLPAAIGTLRDGLELGQHVGQGPLLLHQLIGYGMSAAMLEQVETLVQAPAAPNLYWALAELPRPLISFRKGLTTDSNLLVMKFPALAHLDDPNLRPDWERLLTELRIWAHSGIPHAQGARPKDLAAIEYDEPTDEQIAMARAYLRQSMHRSAEEVKAMSSAEVQVRYSVALFREVADAWRKWFLLPYSQALPDASQRNSRLLAEAKRREIIPLSSQLMPIEVNFFVISARFDRRIARLQTIEALRMHAAVAGKLPASLDELKVAPVPHDPVNGQPFLYKLDGEVATLDAAETDKAERELLRVPTTIALRSK